MKEILRNKKVLYLAVFLFSTVLVGTVLYSGLLHKTSVRTSDVLYDRKPAPERIVVVGIDDGDLQEVGRWPWDRKVFARAVDNLNNSEVIGVDLSFFEESNPESDEQLAQSLSNTDVVLASEHTTSKNKRKYLEPIFNSTAGHVNLLPGEDGTIRTAPMQLNNTPSFSLKIVEEVSSGPVLTPTNLLIPFYKGPPVVSFRDVLNNTTNVSFEDKIVLVGITAPDFHDTHRTPVAKQNEMPGVVIHANIVNALLKGDFLSRQSTLGVGFFVALLSAVAILLFLLLDLKYAVPASLILGLFYFLLAEYKFTQGVVYDLLYPLSALTLTFIGGIGVLYLTESLNKKKIKDVFGRYVSQSVVDEIVEKTERGEDIGVEGKSTCITVMFADITGFTSFTEQRSPKKVVEKLNKELERMTYEVMEQKGTIDKYIGDEIMAFWNAPLEQEDHAVRAVQSAVNMLQYDSELEFGIGINTGEAIVGNIGSVKRLEYTAIGDSVNVASRLCDTAGPNEVLITERVKNSLNERFDVEHYDELSVKGREHPVKVYQVIIPEDSK